ncbi:MAG: hypothetical protein ACKO6N_19680 [Myxococcota bacterium]
MKVEKTHPENIDSMAVLTPTSDTERRKIYVYRKRIFFAIYYMVEDAAFERAAKTWKTELETNGIYRSSEDVFLLVGVHKEEEFKLAWQYICEETAHYVALAHLGQIFSHASKGDDIDGLEFYGSTLNQTEIAALPRLNWSSSAQLILAGCNSGLIAERNWSPAEAFANSQQVRTIGQQGFAYFSAVKNQYKKIQETSPEVYLWAYRRGRNGFGGQRLSGIECSPTKKATPASVLSPEATS